MIKKTSTVIFLDGPLQGEHTRKGAFPLSKGEIMEFDVIQNKKSDYRLVEKLNVSKIEDEDVITTIIYHFEHAL